MTTRPSHRRGSTEQRQDRWEKLGTVGKPHGLKGGFFLSGRRQPLPEALGHLKVGQDLHAAVEGEVLKVYPVGAVKQAIIWAHAQDRTAVEKLRDSTVWMLRRTDPSDPATTHPDELYNDLAQSEILDQNGQVLGVVVDIENHGAQNILIIEGRGLCAGKGFVDVPYVEAYFDLTAPSQVPRSQAPRRLSALWNTDTFADLWRSKR